MPLNTLLMKVTRTRDWSWRFVDHDRKILTLGFRSHKKLMEYRNSFSDRPPAIVIMQGRYKQYFGEGRWDQSDAFWTLRRGDLT